ncbi:B3 domain-containing transcription factor VRN1 [Morus notabilis]|uniref:B3 domain-containing transcription factor VRN1 n=1 Tax=Morus notabilis TaxID=981085 RepID=W9SKQ9_9ROSA|nr:B3 domain-containing transcription factor VRN1 [Morus notabilis]
MNVCGNEKDDVQTKFSLIIPHFFKIILKETLNNNKLQIPNKFLRLYGDTLSGKVCLELPCGLRWEVRLTKSNGKVWMDKGWTDFSKYYSLGHGDLLVFRYEGNSKFHVLIFDKSTTEIDYPSNPNRFEKHDDTDRKPHEFCVEEGIEDDDSVVEVPETFLPHPKTREKSPIPCPRPHKRARTNRHVDKTQSNQSYQRPKADNINFPTKGGGGEKSVPPRRKKCGDTRKKLLTAKEMAKALRRASGFKSKDPFSKVKFVMQPSYVGAECTSLWLPSFFVKKYLKSKHADVILKAPDGRTWSVKYTFGVHEETPEGKFYLSTDILFEVYIFRENGNSTMLPVHKAAASKVRPKGSLSSKVEAGNTINKKTEMSAPETCRKPLTINKKARALETASGYQSENPFFTVTLGASYTTKRCDLNLPTAFSKNSFEGKAKTAILQVGNISWPVELLHYPSDYKFSRGWYAFAKEMSLRPGDVCIFELIDRNKLVLKVSIFGQNRTKTLNVAD